MNATSSFLGALILAAGQGKRMGSPLAKVLHPVGGKPMVRHVVDAARAAGASCIAVVVGHQAEAVRTVFSPDEKDVRFALQAEQLGTGHAAAVGLAALDEKQGEVLLLCGDVPLLRAETLRDLLERRRKSNAAAAVLTAVVENPAGYGRVLRAEGPKGDFLRVVEDADATEEERRSREINTGTYAFDLRFLASALPRLRSENRQGEYYLPDVLSLALADGLPVVVHTARDAEEVLGVNNPDELTRANTLWADRKI
jgi:bifunctional UDP-N-acetylglucosamine pyrophosphorylase/glucosamine-1-phosphate N-acetyltransferase